MNIYFSKDDFALKVLREFNELTEARVMWEQNEEGIIKYDDDFILTIELPYSLSLHLFVTSEFAREPKSHIKAAEILFEDMKRLLKGGGDEDNNNKQAYFRNPTKPPPCSIHGTKYNMKCPQCLAIFHEAIN